MIDKSDIKDALGDVQDPELGMDIVNLGFIYDIDLDGNKVEIDMTLTSPGCPMGRTLVGKVKKRLEKIEEVDEAEVNLVWEPQWTPEKMTDEAREKLGF